MYARAVDEAARHLGELRTQEREGFVLGAVALVAAVVAAAVAPSFALPLFAAASFSLFRVVRAAVRRCELVDALATDADAHGIAEVARRARRAASMSSRRALAASARRTLADALYAGSERILGCAAQLEALATELDRVDLGLDPVSAVMCERLLTDGQSPLHNHELPATDLFSQLNHIRSGFFERRDAGAFAARAADGWSACG